MRGGPRLGGGGGTNCGIDEREPAAGGVGGSGSGRAGAIGLSGTLGSGRNRDGEVLLLDERLWMCPSAVGGAELGVAGMRGRGRTVFPRRAASASASWTSIVIGAGGRRLRAFRGRGGKKGSCGQTMSRPSSVHSVRRRRFDVGGVV
ncbi:unnamed protein product [Mycena citricolor]|uniref:Uncharacterized protein n=1 Tax=Mycena citricolor TaxID=2018698 RepID=A0AAD2HIM4_9AGAR|nr:unnamed protein product [Mycena citricolor]